MLQRTNAVAHATRSLWHHRACRSLRSLWRPQLNAGTLGGREAWSRYIFSALADVFEGCIVRRMPRMQVYLPDDLYDLVKKRRLPASELLQDAVRAEVRRRQLLAEGEKYVAELTAEVGKPTARQRAAAAAVVKKLGARPPRKAG